MDLKDFKKKFKNALSYLDIEKHKQIFERCKKLYSQDLEFRNSGRVYVISMEECAELSQVLSKLLRGNCDKHKLIEEIADVEICLEYIKDLQNISEEDINKAKNIKDDRALERIEETGKCW